MCCSQVFANSRLSSAILFTALAIVGTQVLALYEQLSNFFTLPGAGDCESMLASRPKARRTVDGKSERSIAEFGRKWGAGVGTPKAGSWLFSMPQMRER